MTFEITPYAVISGIGACMAGLVALISWGRRNTPGGKSLTALMLAAAIWAGGAALEHATIGIPGQILWSKFEYIGTVSCPVLLLTFAFEYNHLQHWLTRRTIAILFVVPLITLALAFTNEQHNLIWTTFIPSPAGDNLTIFNHGIAFWIGAVGYSYLLILIGTILLIRGAIGLPAHYRRQIVLIVAGALTPWVVNVLYIAGLSPVPGLELTPLVIVFTGAIFAWAIFQFGLLDLVPIARHTLIETMAEGMLVLDQQNRVVDANPAAQHLLGEKTVISIGAYVGDIFNDWPELKKLFLHNNPEMRTELTVGDSRGGHLEINISPVHDSQQRFTGQFIVLRDITEKRRIQDELQDVNEHLRLQLAEIKTLQANLRERAIRDSLTGLYNRRYLDETLERELSRARRENYEISVLMIDIDHFKELNDTHGHKAGDQVLKELGDFLLTGFRLGDIVCRYGGEEFLIIMPGVQLKDAHSRAQALCQTFNKTVFRYEKLELRGTISIGVAVFPRHGNTSDEIIRAADAAMYAAKQAGRNTVCVK
jgi:diguanylate cyclase (GGDEF)-like protein/PAS domain S-box-containing protein